MKDAFRPRSLIVLFLSLIGIYFLAPTLDWRMGMLVSLEFALIMIVSSGIVWSPQYFFKYISYIGISLGTYFILFNDQPWDFLFHGGLYESSFAPLFFCSFLMTLAGWLLLPKRKQRIIYTIITLGLQIPIALFVGSEIVQEVLVSFSRWLRYDEYYSVKWQAWQFEWMLTYYLPIYFLKHWE